MLFPAKMWIGWCTDLYSIALHVTILYRVLYGSLVSKNVVPPLERPFQHHQHQHDYRRLQDDNQEPRDRQANQGFTERAHLWSLTLHLYY